MFSRNFEEIRVLPEAELIEVGLSEEEANEARFFAVDREIRDTLARFADKPRSFAVFWVDAYDRIHAYAGMPKVPDGADPIAHHNGEASRLFHLVTTALPILCDYRRRGGDDDEGSDDEPVVDPDPSSPDMAQS